MLPIAFFMYFVSSALPGNVIGNYNKQGKKITFVENEGQNMLHNWLFGISWIPIVPTSCLITNLADPFTDKVAKDYCINSSGQSLNCGYFQSYHIPNWYSWTILAIQIPAWFFVYLYLEKVLPDTYGITKHPCFCCISKKTHQNLDVDTQNENIYNKKDKILIQNLTKKFGDFTAVKNLTVSIKENEIFTILGHNGAGKTTAIYMLTGLLKPTSGNAIIYGDSILSNLGIV